MSITEKLKILRRKYDHVIGGRIETPTMKGVCVAIFYSRSGDEMILVETDDGGINHANIQNSNITEVEA